MNRRRAAALAVAFILRLSMDGGTARCLAAPADGPDAVPPPTLRGKILCGYQGWFRCPGDAAQMGWVHWSRDHRRLTPETICFEMWPDLSEYGPAERHAAPGFTYPDGRLAELFSSEDAATVRRHFEWMRTYGIDGAWLQHFVVDLPGGPAESRYRSRHRVLEHVREAAEKTGRAWALSFDIAGMPSDRTFEVLTGEWKRLVDAGITRDRQYLHDRGRPVVQVWGFYRHSDQNRMTIDLAEKLIAFFHEPGHYAAYLVGGGDWDWRESSDRRWRAALLRLDAYAPWNVGNYVTDGAGVRHASLASWAEDRRECERRGVLWLPVVYPGFGWDNLQRKPPGTTTIPRDRGRFLWEQFVELKKLEVDCAYVAMFDEVDEGTAIFKVTSTPPTQAHFVDLERLPSDWYLRLVGEGGRMLRGQRPLSREIPIRP